MCRRAEFAVGEDLYAVCTLFEILISIMQMLSASSMKLSFANLLSCEVVLRRNLFEFFFFSLNRTV